MIEMSRRENAGNELLGLKMMDPPTKNAFGFFCLENLEVSAKFGQFVAKNKKRFKLLFFRIREIEQILVWRSCVVIVHFISRAEESSAGPQRMFRPSSQ